MDIFKWSSVPKHCSIPIVKLVPQNFHLCPFLKGTTWCQFPIGTFLCPWMIHRPNFEVNRSKHSQIIARKLFSDCAPGGTTWCQFSTGTFLCPWLIHRPNLKSISQIIPELLHRSRFQMAPSGGTRRHHLVPVFERNLPLSMSDPQTKFEVKSVEAFASYRTETIFRWSHLVAPGSTMWCQFSKGTFLCPWVIHRPNLKWIGQSLRVIARKPFSDGTTWWHQAVPPGASFQKELSSVH